MRKAHEKKPEKKMEKPEKKMMPKDCGKMKKK